MPSFLTDFTAETLQGLTGSGPDVLLPSQFYADGRLRTPLHRLVLAVILEIDAGWLRQGVRAGAIDRIPNPRVRRCAI